MRVSTTVAAFAVGSVAALLTLRAFGVFDVPKPPLPTVDAFELPSSSWPLSTDRPFVELGEGAVPVGVVEHDFQVRNNSSEAVRPKILQQSCTCAKPTFADAVVPPGGSTLLHVLWDVPPEPGRPSFSVEVGVEGEPSARLRLGGTMTLHEVLRADPGIVRVESLRPDHVERRTVVVRTFSGDFDTDRFELSGGSEAGFSVAITDRTKTSVDVEVAVTGVPGAGRKAYAFQIHTGSETQPSLTVPVVANHLPFVVADRRAVVLDARKPHEYQWVRLKDHRDEGRSPEVESVETQHPEVVRTSWRERDGGLEVGFSLREDRPIEEGSSRLAGLATIGLNGGVDSVAVSYLILN